VIVYELPRATDVTLKVYNVLGQEVRTLLQRKIAAGKHQVVWDGKNEIGHLVSSGVYFYRFIAGPVDETKKMLILK
jgi:flagellar hook assembly protein FlgD